MWLAETMRRASWDDRSWCGVRNVRIAAAAMAPRLEMTLHRSVCIRRPDRRHLCRLWHPEIGAHLEAVEVAVAEASAIGLEETDHELLVRGPEGFPQVCGNRPELGMLPDRADPLAASSLGGKRLQRMRLDRKSSRRLGLGGIHRSARLGHRRQPGVALSELERDQPVHRIDHQGVGRSRQGLERLIEAHRPKRSVQLVRASQGARTATDRRHGDVQAGSRSVPGPARPRDRPFARRGGTPCEPGPQEDRLAREMARVQSRSSARHAQVRDRRSRRCARSGCLEAPAQGALAWGIASSQFSVAAEVYASRARRTRRNPKSVSEDCCPPVAAPALKVRSPCVPWVHRALLPLRERCRMHG
jgi:hypothetical protein